MIPIGKRYNTPHRSRVVKTRMTEEEYADFTERLKNYDMSQAEFIRQAITRATIRPIVTVSPVNDELLSAVGKLTAEYGKIGGNLNQIARSLNEYGTPYNALSVEVRAAIIVLFIFGIVFCVASTIATILCGIGTLEVYGIGYKLFLAVETGIFITAGTLPLIVLVVFFSKTYVFSILLCVFYSVLNMSATALFDTLPKTMLWLLPTPLTTFWSAGDMAAHGIKMDLEQMTGLIPSTFQVVFILGIMALVSFLLIDRLYKQRGE